MNKKPPRGRPTTAYKASLRKARRVDYDRLVQAAIDALVRGDESVLLAFSHLTRFPESFPKGHLVSKEPDGRVIRKVRSRKLLGWLHEQGHTRATVEMVGVQKRLFAAMEKDFENFL